MTTKLSTLIFEISGELESIGDSSYGSRQRKHHSKKLAELNLVLTRFEELLVILGRLLRHQQVFEGLPKDLGKASSAEQERFFRTNQKVRIDIKSCYYWACQIRDAFRRSSAKSQMPNELSELSRICLIRHKFIEHYAEIPLSKENRTPRFPTLTGALGESPQIMFLEWRKSRLPRLRGTIRAAEKEIPEISKMDNEILKIQAMYERLNEFSDSLKRGRKNKPSPLEELFQTRGLLSEPPEKIAESLLRALRRYREVKRI